MEQYSIGGLPVLSKGKLVGIITKRDIRFESDLNTLVKNRMTSKNLITVDSDTSNEDAKKILQKHRIERLLVVDKKNNLDGLITVKDLTKKEEFPFSTKDKNIGTGLGLSIVEKIISEHEGNFHIYNIDDESGACSEFTLRLYNER